MNKLKMLENGGWENIATETYVNDKLSEISQMVSRDVVFKPYDFNGKTAAFFGDSICVGVGSSSGNNYVKIFSEKVGLTATNYGASGTCFTDVRGGTTIVSNIKSKILTQDFVFIEGGINDWYSGVTESNFRSTIEDLCTYLDENYTGTVIFITPINCTWSNDNEILSLNQMREIMTESATLHGYDIVQGGNFGFPTVSGDLAGYLYYDGLHPSNAGYKLIAKCLTRALC